MCDCNLGRREDTAKQFHYPSCKHFGTKGKQTSLEEVSEDV